MASSSTQDISTTLPEGDDVNFAVNRALYFEPVLYALRKFSAKGLTEDNIVRTVIKNTGDSELYTNFLIEHQEALSTFGIGDLQSLFHFLFLFYESFDFI